MSQELEFSPWLGNKRAAFPKDRTNQDTWILNHGVGLAKWYLGLGLFVPMVLIAGSYALGAPQPEALVGGSIIAGNLGAIVHGAYALYGHFNKSPKK